MILPYDLFNMLIMDMIYAGMATIILSIPVIIIKELF